MQYHRLPLSEGIPHIHAEYLDGCGYGWVKSNKRVVSNDLIVPHRVDTTELSANVEGEALSTSGYAKLPTR